MTHLLYILRCHGGKYYVGKTNRYIGDRLQEHFDGTGSAWTRLHSPDHLIRTIPDPESWDEDKYTKLYMQRYGIHNVRGGAYIQVELDSRLVYALKRELRSAHDACFRCGGLGHFQNRCCQPDPFESDHEPDLDPNESDHANDCQWWWDGIL